MACQGPAPRSPLPLVGEGGRAGRRRWMRICGRPSPLLFSPLLPPSLPPSPLRRPSSEGGIPNMGGDAVLNALPMGGVGAAGRRGRRGGGCVGAGYGGVAGVTPHRHPRGLHRGLFPPSSSIFFFLFSSPHFLPLYMLVSLPVLIIVGFLEATESSVGGTRACDAVTFLAHNPGYGAAWGAALPGGGEASPSHAEEEGQKAPQPPQPPRSRPSDCPRLPRGWGAGLPRA
jgi:hypothetical protein